MQLLWLLLYHDGEKSQCFENDQKSRTSVEPLNETFSSAFPTLWIAVIVSQANR